MDESVVQAEGRLPAGRTEGRWQKFPPLQSCELVPTHGRPSYPRHHEQKLVQLIIVFPSRNPAAPPARFTRRHPVKGLFRPCGRKSRALSSGCFSCSTWGGSVGAPSHLLQSIAPSTSRQTSEATINRDVAESKVSGLRDTGTVRNGAF